MKVREIREVTASYIKEKPIYLLVAALFIVSSLVIPYFFTRSNIINIFFQASDLIIVSCGLTFVILNGGIDFSITAVLGLSSIIGAMLMNMNTGLLRNSPFNVPLSLLVMLLIGVLIGSINGLAVSRLKMPSFIATMSTNLLFGGIALAIANSKPVSNFPKAFMAIGRGKVIGLPVVIIIAVVVVACLQFLLFKTVFGKRVFAIGTNMRASVVTGLPVKQTIFFMFLISGVVSSIGGIVSTARIGVGMPALGAERFIDFMSAVVLGGTSVFGGIGSIVGTFFGALFVATLSNALSMLGLQWYFIMVAKGVIIVIIAAFDAIKRFGGND